MSHCSSAKIYPIFGFPDCYKRSYTIKDIKIAMDDVVVSFAFSQDMTFILHQIFGYAKTIGFQINTQQHNVVLLSQRSCLLLERQLTNDTKHSMDCIHHEHYQSISKKGQNSQTQVNVVQ
jgi:hypothetical protein